MDSVSAILPPASPNFFKRSFDEARLQELDLSHPAGPGNTCAALMTGEDSPLSKSIGEGLPPGASLQTSANQYTNEANSSTQAKPASKRRKLTPAEQEAKRSEKELKERHKEEEKARKELEKEEKQKAKEAQNRQKEDEKKKKDVEKQKLKESQNRQKEEEKRRKEEEKQKKEKSQLRLSSFFVQSSGLNGAPPGPCGDESLTPSSSRRNSISSINDADASRGKKSITSTPQKTPLSEYERLFPAFFLQSYTVLAPQSRFTRDEEGLRHVNFKIDQEMQLVRGESTTLGTSLDLPELLHIRSYGKPHCKRPHVPIKEILGMLYNDAQNPVDLTKPDSAEKIPSPMNMLNDIPIKYLKFAEDVRPPYIGTYTKNLHVNGKKTSRNPFARSLPATNYDYDSEAEWEEPEEGEDLNSEGEEENFDEEEGDEMEGFLDDEEADDASNANNAFVLKRRQIAGNLEPVCTGLCWGESTVSSDSPGNTQIDLSCYRLEMISDTPTLPIDPYATSYWQSDSSNQALSTPMNPPRLPLASLHRNNTLSPNTTPLNSSHAPIASTNAIPRAATSTVPKRLITSDQMDAFKAAIAGCELTKAGLVEVLKKQFPKQSKDAIKDTLGLIAERKGVRESDKRWIIKPGYET